MKSRANISGHPIHPMLIPFPVAFFTGTLIFDVLAVVNNNESLWNIGEWLIVAGIIGGVLAAIPGVIDFLGTVPPDSSAKKRATKHGLTNVAMLILFVSPLTTGEAKALRQRLFWRWKRPGLF